MTDADTVLVVTEPNDSHADFVIDKLNGAGVRVVRIHPEDLPENMQVSLTPEAAGLSARVDYLGRSVGTREIRSAWLRRPRPVGRVPAADPGLARYLRSNSLRAMEAFYRAIPDERWLSSPWALEHAECKPLQLAHAAAVGLAVPTTTITNDPREARAFRRFLGSTRCAVKPLHNETVANEQGFRMPLTQIWDAPDEAVPDSTLGAAPTIYQGYVEKERELRCVVVGSRVLAADIGSQAVAETKIDSRGTWMKGMDVQPYELPPEVAARLVALTARFGVRFASLDLVVEAGTGRYVFLDLNPNGQWLWLELEAGLPVSRMIADHLAGSPTGAPVGAESAARVDVAAG